MPQVVSLSFYRFDTPATRVWAYAMMALARRPLNKVRDIGFWKLCGSGGGVGFTPRLNVDVFAILATWPDEATARQRMADTPIFQTYTRKAVESWTVFLSPASVRGAWSGQTPFASGETRDTGPLAVLTRATIRPKGIRRFWARVPDISDRIAQDGQVAFKIGIGENPLFQQITFSIWPDAQSMKDFAYTGAHAAAIKAVRDGGWFHEELFARFNVLSDAGTWGGTTPLAGLINTKDAA